MTTWKPGDRVAHTAYGTGTVLEFTAEHAVVHFDVHGRKKFNAKVVALAAVAAANAPTPPTSTIHPPSAAARPPAARRAGGRSERPTEIGYENEHEQSVSEVIKAVGMPVTSRVYVLECLRCGETYRERAAEIPQRQCPACMGGPPGLDD